MQNLCLNNRTNDHSVGAINLWLYLGELQVHFREAVSSLLCIGWHFWLLNFVSSSACFSKSEVAQAWMTGGLCPKERADNKEVLGAAFIKLLQLFSTVRRLLHDSHMCSFRPFCFLQCQADVQSLIPSVTCSNRLNYSGCRGSYQSCLPLPLAT